MEQKRLVLIVYTELMPDVRKVLLFSDDRCGLLNGEIALIFGKDISYSTSSGLK